MDPEQKRVAEQFDQYGDTYNDAVNSALGFSGLDVDYFTRYKADHLVALLGAKLENRAHSVVLDVGCGIGNYHAMVRPSVGRLHGVDVSSACVTRARQRNPDVEYACYEGASLPYGDSFFDASFTICVMHHVPIEARRTFVMEMARVTKPGGIAVMYEHNPWNPLTMRVVNNCEFDEDAVLLTMPESRRLFATAFEQVETRSILTIPAKGSVLCKLDAALGRLPVGAQYCLTATNSDSQHRR